MNHDLMQGIGVLAAALLFGMIAVSALTKGEAQLGRGRIAVIARNTHPLYFWGYVLVCGALSAALAFAAIDQIVHAIAH